MISKKTIMLELAKTASELDAAGLHKQANKLDKFLVSLSKDDSRTNFIFPPDHPKVTDGQGHYPIGDKAHAHNALSRASQHSEKPTWWSGSLEELVNAIQRKVHKEYPGIKLTEKSSKPGKG